MISGGTCLIWIMAHPCLDTSGRGAWWNGDSDSRLHPGILPRAPKLLCPPPVEERDPKVYLKLPCFVFHSSETWNLHTDKRKIWLNMYTNVGRSKTTFNSSCEFIMDTIDFTQKVKLTFWTLYCNGYSYVGLEFRRPWFKSPVYTILNLIGHL